MHIDHYQFGRIQVDGDSYGSDVIITPERVLSGWWRREGHSLHPDDLEVVVAAMPDRKDGAHRLLIVGTGYYGRMQVPHATQRFLEKRGIDLEAVPTKAAVETYNRLAAGGGAVVAALHLTC